MLSTLVLAILIPISTFGSSLFEKGQHAEPSLAAQENPGILHADGQAMPEQ